MLWALRSPGWKSGLQPDEPTAVIWSIWFGPELQSFEEIRVYGAEPLFNSSVSKFCQLHLRDVELAANMGKRLHCSESQGCGACGYGPTVV